MYISIHIPKTAGTTLGYILDLGFRRKVFYDYTQLDDKPELLQKDIAHLQANKDFIAERFKLIHGHFHYKKYGDIFPNAKYITCLREPLKRTVSQYHHIIQEADPNHWLYERLSTGKMDFVEFTSLPNICRAQSWHLDGIAIEDMAHVSLSENLVDSIYQFQVLFNFERNDPYMAFKGAESIPNTNPSNARHIAKTEIPYSHLEQAKKILCEDYDLYERGIQKFIKQAKLTDKIINNK